MCKYFKSTNIFSGGFSEYIYLSEEHLKNDAYKLPENMTYEEISLDKLPYAMHQHLKGKAIKFLVKP